MRYCTLCASALFLALQNSNAWADKVEGLVTFQAGTPAKASEVNGNFTAVKTAVDNNDDRLTAVETDKQNRVTGTCADNSAVKSIDADGSVVCEPFQTAAVLMLGPASFSLMTANDSSYCGYNSWHLGYMRGARSTSCSMVALVNLPQAVEITDLQCSVKDNATGSARISAVELWRTSLSTGSSGNITYTPTSVDSATPQMLIAGGTAGGDSAIVDNNQYTYELAIAFEPNGTPFNSIGVNLGVYGCKIFYQP